MIAKQFLITGILMGIVGGLLSVFFRMQLGFPDANLSCAGYLERVSGRARIHPKHDRANFVAILRSSAIDKREKVRAATGQPSIIFWEPCKGGRNPGVP